jgi:hypothetical protein
MPRRARAGSKASAQNVLATKLCHACVAGDVRVVNECLGEVPEGADRARLVSAEVVVEGVGDGPAFPLAFASWCGHLEVATALLDDGGADVNQRSTECSDVALGSAVFENHIDVVLLLLSRGANPNIARNDGETPLFYARSARVARALLAHGADVSVETRSIDQQGYRTPAHAAIDEDRVDVLEVILLGRKSTELCVRLAQPLIVCVCVCVCVCVRVRTYVGGYGVVLIISTVISSLA